MKTIRTPAILLGLLYLGLVLWVSLSMPLLPGRVATHFGMGGRPNGWVSRDGYRVFILLFGLGMPTFTTLLGFLTRFFPAWTVNVPNREYWLAPERRSATDAHVLRHCLWLACLEVAFVGGIHYLTILANNAVPVHMPNGTFLAILGVFLASVALWIVSLVGRFRKPV